MTARVATLGFPRIGPRRELKFALENYWAGKSDVTTLQTAAQGLRAAAWARQKSLGADILPSGDFSLYDHVLDTAAMLGAVPACYGWSGGEVGLDTYFAMARGGEQSGHGACAHASDSTALEMTKWFDTNYHYMVPELHAGQRFSLASTKIIDEFAEARALGYTTRPALLGPVTFLTLAKGRDVDPLSLIDRCSLSMRTCCGGCANSVPTGSRSTSRASSSISTRYSAPRSRSPMRGWRPRGPS